MRTLFRMAVAVLLFAPCASLSAQTSTEGSILGTVKDSSGAVLPGAVVTVKNLDTGIVNEATTDPKGYFQVLPLPHGFYSVTVTFPGMAKWTLTRVELTLGAQKRVEPVLGVGGAQEQVTVTAGTTLVQTERSSVQMNVEQKQLRDLPVNGRDPVSLVTLVPGMLYQGINSAQDDHVVQGLGMRNEQTEFTVDGASSNDPSAEQGITLPNMDSVAQLTVESSNFSAADGRNPLQVKLVTKSGTNQFHGTLWEFMRSDAFDATNAFAPTKPHLRRHQFGYSAGGPVMRNKTFFFSSLEHVKTRQQRIYNSLTIDPAFLNGDFSSLHKQLTNPFTGKPFAGNQIPTSMFSPSSAFFFPYLLQPNAPGNRFQALSSVPNDTDNLVLRIDHQASATQRLYGRWIRVGDGGTATGYSPDKTEHSTLVQHSALLHYDWTLTPRTLLSVQGEYLQSDNERVSPDLGQKNLVADAGIQGIATAGREDAIGLPQVNLTGYTGFSDFVQDPASFKRKIMGIEAHLTLVRSKHTINTGYDFSDRRTLAHHASSAPRGLFTFNGQYTGDAFADYALGLVQFVQRNLPIKPFGMAHSPYTDVYVQDDWRATSRLTLNLGLRYDFWHERQFVNGCGATFDKTLGKIIAGQKDGQIDLSCQPTAPFLAAATAGEWVPASQVGAPDGLFKGNGYLSPRIGAAWRPWGGDDFVLRGGAGVFTSQYDGNVFGSSIIGPPYWADERITFSRASLQNWATAFPADPSKFVAPSVSAAVWDIKPMKSYQWNLSAQKAVPFLDSAVTVSYVGNRGRDLTTREDENVVPPGNYANLQAALPYPRLGTIRIAHNNNRSWYDSLQVKVEKRFTKGLGYGLAYALSRDITDFGSNDVQTRPTPFAPAGYEHGPSNTQRRHILRINAIYDIPVGRGRQIASEMPPVLDAVVGGWELSGIYSFVSGQPLTLMVPGATLGNGFNTHPDLVGDPNSGTCSNGAPVHTADCWFNDTAFAAPARYTFGNAGVGVVDGPSSQVIDTALLKNFHTGKQTLVQLRWEMFNALNHVNLNNPVTNTGLKTTGLITGAGSPRTMQFGLKFIF